MANLVARHAFRDLRGLLARANRSFDAPSFVRLLRDAGKRHPDDRMVQLIMYRHKPVKSALAESMLDAFEQSLHSTGALPAHEHLALATHMIEYDCYIPGLGYALQQAKASASDPENQPASSLASIVGCDGSVIQEMTTGSNRLVPYEFAARVSQASMMICKLGNPLDIVRCDANDRTYKPIAAETGREPHKCEQSVAIRRRLLQWFADGAVRPAAAAQ